MTCLYLWEGIFETIDFDNLDKIEDLNGIDAVEYGRKLGIINLLAETAIQTTLWLIKANILVLNYRLT